MAKGWKAIAAALVAAMMLTAFAGCANTNEWAVQVGDTKVESGVYLGYLVSNYNTAKSKAGYSYKTDLSGLWDKKIDKKSVEQWVLDETLNNCSTYVAVSKWFDQLKLTLSSSDNDSITTSVNQSWENMQDMLEKNGCSKASLRKIMTASYKQNMVFKKLYDKGGERAVSDSEIKTYYEANYAKVRMLTESLYNTSTYQSLSDSEVAALESKFKGLAGRIANGADIMEVIKAYKKENESSVASSSSASSSSSSTSSASSASSASGTSEGSNSSAAEETYLQLIDKVSGNYSDELTKAAFGLKVGETTYAKDSYAVYLIQRVNLNTEKDELADNRTAIIGYLKQDAFNKELLENGNKLGITKNDAAITRFSVKKIEKRFVSEEASTN